MTDRGVPTCNPDTLTPCTVCDQPMHVGRPRGTASSRCTQGHYRHGAHGRCRRCHDADRRRGVPTDGGPARVITDTSWQARARCRGANLDLFFPRFKRGENVRHRLEPVAARWCRPCPVRAQCHQQAEDLREHGLWAGVWRRHYGNTYRATPMWPDAAQKAS